VETKSVIIKPKHRS